MGGLEGEDMNARYLTAKQVLSIPESDLPLMVLSDNMQSFFSFGIKAHEHGVYNHFMWMHKPQIFLSQGWRLKEEKVEAYLQGKHRLKLWTNPSWTQSERELLIEVLQEKAEMPWYRTLYDPLQIVGKFTGLDWLQIPGIDICSDQIDYISVLDKTWETKRHLSPPEINRLFKWNETYQVYGRYSPD